MLSGIRSTLLAANGGTENRGAAGCDGDSYGACEVQGWVSLHPVQSGNQVTVQISGLG